MIDVIELNCISSVLPVLLDCYAWSIEQRTVDISQWVLICLGCRGPTTKQRWRRAICLKERRIFFLTSSQSGLFFKPVLGVYGCFHSGQQKAWECFFSPLLKHKSAQITLLRYTRLTHSARHNTVPSVLVLSPSVLCVCDRCALVPQLRARCCHCKSSQPSLSNFTWTFGVSTLFSL